MVQGVTGGPLRDSCSTFGPPVRAKIARVLVDDGGEVNAGDLILETEAD